MSPAVSSSPAQGPGRRTPVEVWRRRATWLLIAMAVALAYRLFFPRLQQLHVAWNLVIPIGLGVVGLVLGMRRPASRTKASAAPRSTTLQAARRGVALMAGLGIIAVALLVALRLGAASLGWADIWHALFHNTGTYQDVVVREFRLPETIIAIEVGAGFAVAGALAQGLTRNPMADCGILGINAGASFTVVAGIAFVGISSPLSYVWFAFPGAILGVAMAFSVWMLGRGKPTPLKLTLGGVVTGMVLGSATTVITMLKPTLQNLVAYWAIGDVNGKTMPVVTATLPFVAIGLLCALPLGRALNGLSTGEDLARALGQRVGWTKTVVILAVILLAGASVAAAGPIGFIGMAVPNAIRGRIGNDYRWILPFSAVYGAALLLLTDILGRVIDRPNVIQTGEIIGLAGALIFIVTVCRRNGMQPL